MIDGCGFEALAFAVCWIRLSNAVPSSTNG